MIRFIKAINTTDKILDCIPIVSTVKNAGILLYQLVHKVNKVANPVNTSWRDDIKIHILSKDDFIAGISMIPIVGNLTALAYHLSNAIAKVQERWVLGGPKGYLGEATRAFSWGLKKHNYEVVALYLARNPNRSEEKLSKALRFAASAGKEEIVKLILDSRNDWSSNSIKEALKFTKDTKIAKIILENCSNILTDKDAGSVVSYLAGNFMQNNYSLIELLIANYPNIDITEIGRALVRASGEEDSFNIVYLLLNSFPKIEEKHIEKALEEASNKGFKDIIELLLQNSPNLVTTHMDRLLENAASRGNHVILNWLLNTFKDNISSTSIGKVLARATLSMVFGEDDKHLLIIKALISKYPNLPGKDLEPAMTNATLLYNELFKIYLNTFTQLQPENLQMILNDAVFMYGKSDEDVPDSYSQRMDEVAKLIKEKFPTMEAVDSYGEFRKDL